MKFCCSKHGPTNTVYWLYGLTKIDSQHTRLPAHPALLQGLRIPSSQHSQACRNVNNNGGAKRNCAWSPFPALTQENAWRPPHWIPFLHACECWEAKHFSTTVLGAQRQGTTVEMGAGCLGLPDPDIILTLVHTTSKPWP